MINLTRLGSFLWMFITITAAGQHISPKPPAKSVKQITHTATATLATRYNRLECAVVEITAGSHGGTGFYIDPEGDIVTVGHLVLEKRAFSRDAEPHHFHMTASLRQPIRVKHADGTVQSNEITLALTPNAWYYELAVLQTHKKTDCYIRLKTESTIQIGSHVMVIGYPALTFGSPALIEGIVASRFKSGLASVADETGKEYVTGADSYAIQMPVTHGFSGSPVINDQDEAIAIMDANGEWRNELNSLLQQAESESVSPANPNTNDYLAALTQLVHNNMNSGFGEATPVEYLDFSPQ
jgi:S1-C subfamily serine protease